jgi:uroporphyrin-III C-methyltransferase
MLIASSHRPPPTLAQPGTVTLVGAGPGDPELLTIKATRAIAAATLLLVDDLVGEGVLAYANPQARVIDVGKRGGCQSTPQTFIEKLMIAAARAGEVVVRVKGGDPFIFGRGGEEVESLRAQGIPVHVVNGITAGLAALTSLGAPLTHREHAHGVVFITGHAKPGDSGTDWRALDSPSRKTYARDLYGGVPCRPDSSGLIDGSKGRDPGCDHSTGEPPQPAACRDRVGAHGSDSDSGRAGKPIGHCGG